MVLGITRTNILFFYLDWTHQVMMLVTGLYFGGSSPPALRRRRECEWARGTAHGGNVKICLREQNQSSEMHPSERASDRDRQNRPSMRASVCTAAAHVRRRRTREASITEGAHCQFWAVGQRRRWSFCTGARPDRLALRWSNSTKIWGKIIHRGESFAARCITGLGNEVRKT